MKKNSFILGLLVMMAFSSCSYDITVTKETIKETTNEYEIDVIGSFVDCKGFDNYRLIEPVNNRMGQIVDSLIYDIKSQAMTYFSENANRRRGAKIERPSFKYQLVSTDTVFIVTNKIISARILAYAYTGGAHGMTRFYALNYSPEIGSFIKLDELLDLTKKEQINALIQKNFVNKDNRFNEKPTLDLAATVNISKKSVIFTYEHYVLGPYSSGYAVIEVPIKELKGILKY